MESYLVIVGGSILGGIVILVSIVVVRFMWYAFRYLRMKQRKEFHQLPIIDDVNVFNLFEEVGTKISTEKLLTDEGNIKHDIVFGGSHMDGAPTIFVTNAEYFKELFDVTKVPKMCLVYDILKVFAGNGLATSTGSHWKTQRKNINPVFRHDSLKSMTESINSTVVKFMDKLKEFDSKEVHACDFFSCLTLETIIECIFGGDEYMSSDIMAPLWEKISKSLPNFFITELIFGEKLNRVLPFPWNLRVLNSVRSIKKLVKKAVDKKIDYINKNSITEKDTSDLLSVLFFSGVTNEETVTDEALTFLFAGHDTTGALLSWGCSFLADNPHVVEAMREEVRPIIGNSRTATYEQLEKFIYVECVVKEILRMRPPAPFLDRVVGKNGITLGDRHFQEGTAIYPMIMTSQFDSRYWKEPFRFRPERFLPSNRNTEPTPHAFAYAPFSQGSRNCIGKRFAVLEAKMVLIALVQTFDISSDMESKDIKWFIEGTLKPTNYKCRFHPIN